MSYTSVPSILPPPFPYYSIANLPYHVATTQPKKGCHDEIHGPTTCVTEVFVQTTMSGHNKCNCCFKNDEVVSLKARAHTASVCNLR